MKSVLVMGSNLPARSPSAKPEMLAGAACLAYSRCDNGTVRRGGDMGRKWGLVAALAVACAPASEDVGDAPDDSGAVVDALQAAADTTLPAAIIGRAGPPRGRDVQYFDGDPSAVGYLSVPAGEGPWPAVILIHEWNGLVDGIRQTADALADEGYVAFAADLYHGETGATREDNMRLMQTAQAEPAAMIANLDAAVAWLEARPDVTGRIGAVGWCFGGGVALSFGLDGAEHEATAIFYGSLVDDPERLASLSHEVYGTFAEQDAGIPVAEVEAFAAALDAAGIDNDIHVYDGVDHGFWLHVERNPAVNTAPARDAWRRLRAYFQRTLKL
jgi:carboxymethylenebutenolidase